MPRLLVSLFALTCVCASVLAQDPVVDRLFPSARRDSSVVSPSRFFQGFGTSYVAYHRAHAYARAVAAASDRVVVEDYGRTATGRLLLKAVVTSARNHGRRQEIREFNRGLMEGSVARIDDQPTTLWLGMSIHGDEGSAVDGGMALLYHLASDRGDEVKQILENVVIIIDVCTNPDGRARFTSGVRDRGSWPPSESRHAYDHKQPWPGGRTNHYMFDLNRDWHLQTQRESRLRAVQFLKERPQVMADLHEMGSDSEYFFSTPPGQPVNQHITREIHQGWTLVGEAIGAAFDQRKWPYWVGDVFPGDYPGYGGLWPCLQGCVGMTFEQAASRAGRIKRRDGGVMTLELALSHHATAAYATARACAQNREKVLAGYRDHFLRVARDGKKDALPWFVMPPRHDPDRLRRLGETLAGNGIRVKAFQRAQVLEAKPLTGGATTSVTVPAGTLAVSSAQPLRPLLLSLLDPEIVVDGKFLEAEARRLEKGKRSEFYDITSWNLPLLFGVETYRVAEIPKAVLTDSWRETIRGKPLSSLDPTTVALLVPGQRLGSSALLAGLLAAEVPVEIAPFECTIGGRSFGRGTLVVHMGKLTPVTRKALDAILQASPADLIFPVKSFKADTGKDLGSRHLRPVQAPRIVVACGRGVSSYSYGAVRWLFERGLDPDGDFHVAHTSVTIDGGLARALEDANVLVLPDGGGYKDRITKKMLETFLGRGGTVVALRGAVKFLASKDMGQLTLEEHPEKDTHGVGAVAGPILRAHLDSEHWLGHGLGEDVAIQCRTSTWWKPVEKKNGTTVLSYGKGADHLKALSGILPERKGKLLAEAPIVIEKVHGRGRVIAFQEDVVFRGTSPGLWKLFLNACLLGPSMAR